MPLAVGGVPSPIPFGPILGDPANAAFADLGAGTEFSWAFQAGTIGNVQSAWAFHRKVAGAASYEYWNAGTSAWQSSAVFNTGTDQDYTFPSGVWTDGKVYNWSVQTQDTAGTGPFAPDATVTAQLGPTVTIVAPTGTISSALPAIGWTPSVPVGSSQTSYRVIVYDSTQYGAGGFQPGVGPSVSDTGQTGSAFVSTVQTLAPLVDFTSYRVYVQITETGGQASPWVYSAFATSYPQPATPTLTAVAEALPDTNSPRVDLTVTGHDVGAPFAGVCAASIFFSDDGGANYWPVRGASALPLTTGSGQVATITDSEPPPGFTRDYIAYVSSSAGAVSDGATASCLVTPSLTFWLKDPLNTAAAIPIHLQPGTLDTVSTDRQQAYQVLGRPDPVVLSDAFELPMLTLTLIFILDSEYQAFEQLRATQRVFLLQGPKPAGQWYVRLGATKNDSTNLPSLRGFAGTGNVVRTIQLTAQVVAGP